MKVAPDSLNIATALLDWYDRHARRLPWRTGPDERKRGVQPDPYHVWLSEVMLQQTRVATVNSYFVKFIRKWPDILTLAKADEDAVMSAWAGLGYYSRARNLKKCAETIVRDFEGVFPQSASELRKLPGIGNYTSAAIAAIAFDETVAAVDGNVERVVSRLCAIETPVSQSKSEIATIAAGLVPPNRSGDFAQAMMDLGATICTPSRPACALCPIRTACVSGQTGTADRFPVKKPKAKIPTRRGAAFVVRRRDGAVYLRKRAPEGLLAGMSEIPMSAWSAKRDGDLGRDSAPFLANWQRKGSIRHTFTHFHIDLEVWAAEMADDQEQTFKDSQSGWWTPVRNLDDEALPVVIKKAIAAAIPEAFATAKDSTGEQT